MKITDIRSDILRTPLKRVIGNSQTWMAERTAHVVRIETDTGLCGIGEAFGQGPIAFVNAAIISHVLKPMLVGRDPLDREVLWAHMYNRTRDSGQKGTILQAISGVDIALWDLAGKIHALPLYKLLGGAFRERIQPYAFGLLWPENGDRLEALAAEASRLAADGFRFIKMKIGRSPQDDVALVRAVREAVGPGVGIIVDANHAYTSLEAIQIGRKLEELECSWFEEPVAPEDLDGYLDVKSTLDIPVAGGEAEYTRWGFRQLLSRRCVDLVQPDATCLGGITEYQKVLALATTWGIPVAPHVWGSAVSLAVGIHLLAAMPDIPGSLTPVQPLLEFDTTPNPLRDDLLLDRVDYASQIKQKGTIPRLEGNGLGISIDEGALQRFREG